MAPRPVGLLIGGGFGFGLVVALRAISGLEIFQTEQTGYPHVIVPAITAPLGFLVGLGCFDYWFRWAAGKPTIPDDHSQHGAKSWKDYFKFNTDHKVIGIQYTVTSIFFFFIGGFLAMSMRAELAQPGTQIVDPGRLQRALLDPRRADDLRLRDPDLRRARELRAAADDRRAGHGVPAPERRSASGCCRSPGMLFLASYLVPGGAFDAGWTGYAPLSTGAPLGQSFFNLGVQFAGASSVATALNFLVTIITMRAPGMNFWRMPLLVWANFSTSLLVVAATPFIAGVQFMVLFDRALSTNFFQSAFGGDVISYQHIFWFYSHPAVYIMMLPGFGIISEVISTHSRKPIFGYRLMALALLGIVVLAFAVWAHHMFVSGHVQLAARADDDHDAADRGADRDQDVLVVSDALRSEAAPVLDGDAVLARLHRHLRDRRHLGGDAGHGADRHPRLRHLFHRRPHPLRAVRRIGVHDLRRDLPLVPEDDGTNVRRAIWGAGTSG